MENVEVLAAAGTIAALIVLSGGVGVLANQHPTDQPISPTTTTQVVHEKSPYSPDKVPFCVKYPESICVRFV